MTASTRTKMTTDNIEEDTVGALQAQLKQFDNTTMLTSIDRIGAGLAYLAQCDYSFGNGNSHLLCDDCLFGRGYLLDMLSSGVNSFAKEFEQTEALFNRQLKQSENLKSQNEQMGLLIEKYQQLLAIDDKSSVEAIALQQQIENLTC